MRRCLNLLKSRAWTGALFALLGTVLAFAQEPLPDADPSRGWDGTAFVESTLSWLRKEHPEVKLQLLARPFHSTSDKKYERGTQLPFNMLLQSFLPADIEDLGGAIYRGEKLMPSASANPESQKFLDSLESRMMGWILSRPDGSVAPHELFGQAIAYAKGDVLLANVALWNILRENWEAAATRNANPLTAKLIDVTGEASLRDGTGHFVVLPTSQFSSIQGVMKISHPYSEPTEILHRVTQKLAFVVTKRGDKFSSYYHFFGMLAASSYLSAKYHAASMGDFLARMGAKREAERHALTAGPETERVKRVWNDLEGARAGATLKRLIDRPALIPSESAKLVTASHYLRRNPDLPNNYFLVKDGRPPVYHNSGASSDYWTGPMNEHELEYRFEHAIWQNAEIFNPVILATSSDGERLLTGMSRYLESGAKNRRLNDLIRLYHFGARGDLGSELDDDFNLDIAANHAHLAKSHPEIDFEEYGRRLNRLTEVIAHRTLGEAIDAMKQELRGAAEVEDALVTREKYVNQLVHSAESFTDFVKMEIPDPSEIYVEDLDRFIVKHLGLFYSYHPSVSAVRKLEAETGTIDAAKEILLRKLPELKSAREFLELVQSSHPSPSDDYLLMLDELVEEHLQKFLDLRPTEAEKKALLAQVNFEESHETIQRKLRFAKAPRSPGKARFLSCVLSAIKK